jgi:hypothetical protein
MRVLLRVAAALLLAIPLFIVVVIVVALAGRRRASLPLESEISRSLERGATVCPSLRAERGARRATPLVTSDAISADHYPAGGDAFIL